MKTDRQKKTDFFHHLCLTSSLALIFWIIPSANCGHGAESDLLNHIPSRRGPTTHGCYILFRSVFPTSYDRSGGWNVRPRDGRGVSGGKRPHCGAVRDCQPPGPRDCGATAAWFMASLRGDRPSPAWRSCSCNCQQPRINFPEPKISETDPLSFTNIFLSLFKALKHNFGLDDT